MVVCVSGHNVIRHLCLLHRPPMELYDCHSKSEMVTCQLTHCQQGPSSQQMDRKHVQLLDIVSCFLS